MSAFTPAGSGGAPSTPITISSASNPLVVNVEMPVAGTEYSYNLPIGCRQFLLQTRSLSTTKFTYVSGESDVIFKTIPRGCFFSQSDIQLTAVTPIYFQSDTSAQMAELIIWT